MVGVWKLIDQRQPFQLVRVAKKDRCFTRKRRRIAGYINNSAGFQFNDSLSCPRAATGAGWIENDHIWFYIRFVQGRVDLPLKNFEICQPVDTDVFSEMPDGGMGSFHANDLYCDLRQRY